MEIGVPAAARELGITEEAILVKLRNGELGGSKIRVGRRDRWFVDCTDVDTWRRRRDVLEGPAKVSSPVQDQVPPTGALDGGSGRGSSLSNREVARPG